MKVIVTRPRLEADAWVKQLQALHFEAIALPLIHIGTPPEKKDMIEAWEHLHKYSAIMFVSSNAVRYFFLLNKLLAAKLFTNDAIKNIVNTDKLAFTPRMWATGPGTRDALMLQSVPNALIDSPSVDAAQFDSEALWNRVQHQVSAGDKVLIVHGSSSMTKATNGGDMNGRSWLADQLTMVGAQVDFVVSYQRSIPEFDADELALIQQATTDGSVWLLSSSEAVSNLKMISSVNLSKARAIATHPRIALKAREAGFGVVYESRPYLPDVVASIESLV